MLNNVFNLIKNYGIAFIILCFALIMNHSFGYITIVGLFVVICFLSITMQKHVITKQDFLMLLCLFTYAFVSFINGLELDIYSILLNIIAPFFFFQYGEFSAKKMKTENTMIMFWIIVIACYCLDVFFIGIKNVISTGQIVGSIDARYLNVESSGVTYALSATQVGLCLDLAVVGLPMVIIAKEKAQRLMFFILFIIALIVTVNMLNRTAIIIAMTCFMVVVGYRFRKNKTVLILSIILALILILIFAYAGRGNSELLELYTERNEDFATAGNRTNRWSYAIEQLFKYPFGWYDGTIYHVHNMWLDIARISGIIPFLILVYFAGKNIIGSFVLIRRYNTPLMYLMLGLNVCFFTSCFVEPIVGGIHFMLYCMLWGFQTTLNIKK